MAQEFTQEITQEYAETCDKILNHYQVMFDNGMILQHKHMHRDFKFLKKYGLALNEIRNGNIEKIYGNYSLYIEKDYTKTKEYYLISINKGNYKAITNLGLYYYLIEKDYTKAKEYYLMSIENGDSTAMNNLGNLFLYIEKDYTKALEYFTMAFQKSTDNTRGITSLGNYHNEIKNYTNAIEYYLMAVSRGDKFAMNNLGKYYHLIENNYAKALEYYLMAIENGNETTLDNLEKNHNTSNKNLLKFYLILNNIKNKNYIINEKIQKLETNQYINIYSNKILESNNLQRCAICLNDNVLNIKMNCIHEICIHCYPTINCCYYNWCKTNF